MEIVHPSSMKSFILDYPSDTIVFGNVLG
jgi:hypothetical protein